MNTNGFQLPGRLTLTRSRRGDPTAKHAILYDGDTLLDLQDLLESIATTTTNYFDTRRAVLQAEHIRLQLAQEEQTQ